MTATVTLPADEVAAMLAVPLVWSVSSAALTVTATPVLQLALVNENDVGATVMLVSPLRASVTATDADGAALRRYVTVALPPSATDRLPVLAVRVGVVVPPPTVNGTAAVVVDSAGLALSNARPAAVWAPLTTPVALNTYGAVVSLPTTVPSTRNSTRLIGPSTSLAVAASGMTTPEANVAPLVGLVSATVGAVLVGGAPPQLTPLTVNAVGFGLLPTHAPLKPIEVEAPVPRLPFQSRLRAVTALPDWVQVADQPCCTRWLASGKVKPSVQPVSGSPRFRSVTLAVKPPGQSLVA